MTLKWNEQAIADVKLEAAARLLNAAEAIQVQHVWNLSEPNPRPFLAPAPIGDFPRRRSGNLQGAVSIEPETVEEIAERGFVRIFYADRGYYGAILAAKGWKGIMDTAVSMQDVLEAILGRPVRTSD